LDVGGDVFGISSFEFSSLGWLYAVVVGMMVEEDGYVQIDKKSSVVGLRAFKVGQSTSLGKRGENFFTPKDIIDASI
jgi:hypothetical protein